MTEKNKLSRLFFNQVQILQKQLEHLLEKEPLKETKTQTPKKDFQVQTDLTQIDSMSVGLSSQLSERAPMLFSKLSVYFDSGLLFQRAGQEWKATAGFDQGDFFPLKGVEIQIPFKFPDMTLIEVRRVHSREIFSHLMDLQILRSEKGQALIFKPHPDYIFMVTSTLADPWLKPHMERIQREILLLLGDY
jgi:hypothetical protein